MAQCKLTAQEFIQDVFSPMVAVQSSHDADMVCQRNNLTFVELIQPFCKLTSEAQIRDAGNMTYTIRNLKITFRDMNHHPPQPILAKKMLNEVVAQALPANVDKSMTNIMTVGDYDLQISGSTPWYEAYREMFRSVAYPSDHEYIWHYLACIFVVSSSHADPMDQFAKLTQQQHLQQHQQPHKLPKWFCPNVLRYYVLIHDVLEEQESKAESVYSTMKNTYGINSCHLLQVNSRHHHEDMQKSDDAGSIPDPWSLFLHKKQDFLDGEFESTTGDGELTFPSKLSEGANVNSLPNNAQSMIESAMEVTEEGESQSNIAVDSIGVIDHPLSQENISDQSQQQEYGQSVENSSSLGNSKPHMGHKRSSSDGHGKYLSLSDHDRLRIFVHEFAVRGLIPWAERMLRTLTDQVVTRKAIHRSLFSATKKWFGSNKSNPTEVAAAEKTNVVYTPEAPEMQMRRLADLAFMFQLYENAYQMFHACKRDFTNDHAWLHFAGASEMAGMSVFMQGSNSQREYPHHYMEKAITTYLTCRNAIFAARATFLNTEALKSKNMYEEAAMQFIKMTSEDSDLRSALLLEQASHCFTKMKQPMVRKYAFHMILAGHRFSKAGQRRHALRSYSQALQVYKGKSWSLAEDHIQFTLGRQSFNMKQLDNATAAFKHLLTANSKQSSPQQNAFLREYLFVYKQVSDSHEVSLGTQIELPQLPLPIADGNATKILCSTPFCDKDNLDSSSCFASSVNFDCNEADNETWQKLEELLLVSNVGSLPQNFKPSIQCFTSKTENTHHPLVVINEPVLVQVCLENPLKIPLVLTNVYLLWKFVPTQYENNSAIIPSSPPTMSTNEMSGDTKEGHNIAYTQSLPEVILQGSEKKLLQLELIPHETGELQITGVAYNLGTSPLQHTTQLDTTSSSTDPSKTGYISSIIVSGKVNLEVQGARLNSTKEEKSAKMYGPDRRLDLVIIPLMPRLQVSFSGFPSALLCGEVCQVTVTLTNTGSLPLTNLKVASPSPEFFTLAIDDSTKQSSETSRTPDSVYQTLMGPSTVDEFLVKEQKVKHVLPLNIPGSQILKPNQTVNLPLWICGPPSQGDHNIKFLFYYESTVPNPKLHHRVLRHEAQLKVLPSLMLTGSTQRANVCQTFSTSPNAHAVDANKLTLSLQVQNINKLSDPRSSEFSILQVSSASSEWKLSHLSTEQHSDIKVGCEESSLMSFRCTRCRHTSKHSNDEQQVFANVTFDQYEIDSTSIPCSDFFFRSKYNTLFEDIEVEPPKPAMVVESKKKPQANDVFKPIQKALESVITLIVLWKAVIEDESGNKSVVHGQHQIALSNLNEEITKPSIPKITGFEEKSLQIIKPVKTNAPEVSLSGVTSQLLKYTMHHTQICTQNFAKNSLCVVPVTVNIHNCSDTSLEVEIQSSHLAEKQESAESDTSAMSRSFSGTEVCSSMLQWSGPTHNVFTVESQKSVTIQLIVNFFKPGVYQLSSLQVFATPKLTSNSTALNRVLQKNQSTDLIVIKHDPTK